MIPLGQVCAQGSDSTCFSHKEARAIDQQLIDGLECDSTLKVEKALSSEKDKKIKELNNEIRVKNADGEIKDRVINMHIHDKDVLNKAIKVQKKKNAGTVAIASIIVLVSLFIAIK